MANEKSFRLQGGVAVVTGAASGIGAALAEALARRGMDLALCDRNDDGLAVTAARVIAAGRKVSVHLLDVTDREATAALPQAVVGTHGRVTVLVNNAGVAAGGTFDRVDEADFDWVMDVNFHSVVRLTRAFLPYLARERAAQLVNVSSIFGIVAPPGQSAYCASKFAVRGFSESLRHELEMAGSRVGVTLVHPGGIRTAIAENARRPKDATQREIAEQMTVWQKMLRMPPAEAGETIARAIERREPRVLVGDDAKQAALLQRLMPVDYWKMMALGIKRQVGR